MFDVPPTTNEQKDNYNQLKKIYKILSMANEFVNKKN